MFDSIINIFTWFKSPRRVSLKVQWLYWLKINPRSPQWGLWPKKWWPKHETHALISHNNNNNNNFLYYFDKYITRWLKYIKWRSNLVTHFGNTNLILRHHIWANACYLQEILLLVLVVGKLEGKTIFLCW